MQSVTARLAAPIALLFLLSAVEPGLTDAPGFDAPAATVAIVARAKGQLPDKDTVNFIAAYATARNFTADQRPNWNQQKIGAIATELCGDVENGYVDALNTRNKRSDLTTDTVLGTKVWDVAWPACLTVQRNVNYTIKPRDTLTGIRLDETGDFAPGPGVKDYFANSGIAYKQKYDLPVGKILKLPFRTVNTLLQIDATAAQTVASVTNRHVLVYQPAQGGKVIGVIEESDQGDASSSNCAPGDEHYPFDAARLAYLYNFVTAATGKEPQIIDVADNGFFGVPCKPDLCPIQVGNALQYSDRFSADFFPPPQYYQGSNDIVGPRNDAIKIDPLNYRNEISQDEIDESNGHGTFVAGLAIGGEAFESYRSTTIESQQRRAMIEISILTVAPGTTDLPPGADLTLEEYLHMLQIASIVNMSLEFDDRSAQNVQKTFGRILRDNPQTLFVAAAGNEKADLDNGRYLPAAMGGPDAANLMTVVSIDGDGELSSFSNWGEQHTDIAAPGCRIVSWLDADNEAVPLSGTSAAAPIVSFGAGLLRSSWLDAPPQAVKNRIIYSGDLLKDPVKRDRVSSRAALNMMKALFWNWDYIDLKGADGTETSYLGTVDEFAGYSCPNAPTGWQNLKSIKRDGDAVYVYQAAGGGVSVCKGALANTIGPTSAPNVVAFAPSWKLTDAPPYVENATGASLSIPVQCVKEVVRSEAPVFAQPAVTGTSAKPPLAIQCGA